MGQVNEDAKAPYQPNEAEKLLIAALRSGKYSQTTGCLRDERGYCCLGVAEDVLNPEPWQQEDGRTRTRTSTRWVKGAGINYYLTPETTDLLGWSDTAGVLRSEKYGGSLASRNDDGATFDEIADFIEQGKVQRA